jgi:hypothetical protein
MSQTVPAVEGETLLEEMGDKPELHRGLNMLGNLALVLSDNSPDPSRCRCGRCPR